MLTSIKKYFYNSKNVCIKVTKEVIENLILKTRDKHLTVTNIALLNFNSAMAIIIIHISLNFKSLAHLTHIKIVFHQNFIQITVVLTLSENKDFITNM